MRHDRRLSLSNQIYLTFGLTVVVILLFALFYYRISLSALRSKESQYMTNMLSQVGQQTEDITASVKLMGDTIANASASVYLLRASNASQKAQYRQTLNRLITEMSKSNSSVRHILLVDMQGKVYGFSNFDYSIASQLNKEYHLFSYRRYLNGFSGVLKLSDDDSTYYAYIQPVFEEIGVSPENKQVGFCLILCSCDPLYRACSNTASSPNSLFIILDSEQQIIASNQKEGTDLDLEKVRAVFSSEETAYTGRIDGKRQLIQQIPSLKTTGWKVYSIVPYTDISRDLRRVRFIAFLFLAILVLALGFLLSITMKNLTIPLMEIVNFVQKDAYYTLHHKLEIHKAPADLQELADSINQMIARINELTHTVLQNQTKLFETELANNRAQIYALQSQLNPHFLYNTLNAIQGLTYLGKDEEIRTAISALSFVLRYSIKGEDMVEVNDEIHCVEKFLQIIAIRFPQRFDVEMRIDDSIRTCKMPRFLLQPLVENAFLHGLEPCPDKGKLTLTGALSEGKVLHFECTDNGVGIPAEKLSQLQEMLHDDDKLMQNEKVKEHVGLLNIHMRLRLMYGAPYGLSLSSAEGLGTKVCVDFPSRQSVSGHKAQPASAAMSP